MSQMFQDFSKKIAKEKGLNGASIIDKSVNQGMKVDILSNLSEMENKLIFKKIEEYDNI